MAPDHGAAQVHETHVSTVVLLGDRAYKIKKPIATDFLDFSTRAARERACRREVALNRRFAPDVYLGVADVTGVDGELCEHVVVMRRLPPDRKLSAYAARGDDLSPWLPSLARHVARFHIQAPRSVEIAAAGSPDAIAARWRAVADPIVGFAGQILDRGAIEDVSELGRRYIQGRTSLLRERAADDRVRDCHGDLLADDVYLLDDGPRFLDCLEFDDRLRYVDVIDDAASLAMDLERCGAPGAARAFMDLYLKAAGDGGPPTLVDFYIAYRALVRCKVACLRWQQGDAAAAGLARRSLEIAGAHGRAAQVRLVLVGGPPGTGKSTLARRIGAKPGWITLSTDDTRKELAGLAPQASGRSAYGTGIYAQAWTDLTYTTVLERARRHLEAGRNVILDGSWSRSAYRALARRLAEGTCSDIAELRCRTRAGIAHQRVIDRKQGHSDADPDVAERIAIGFEPWPEAIEVDTSSQTNAEVAL